MSKWVDNTEYVGPDRRQRGRSKLIGERRKHDDTGEVPPLGALLRRLRVQMVSFRPESAENVLGLIAGAIGEANRLGYRQCAGELISADRILRTSGASGAGQADAHIINAMDYAGQQR